jgi:hypothetical protein
MTDTNFIRPTSWIHTPDKASGITGAYYAIPQTGQLLKYSDEITLQNLVAPNNPNFLWSCGLTPTSCGRSVATFTNNVGDYMNDEGKWRILDSQGNTSTAQLNYGDTIMLQNTIDNFILETCGLSDCNNGNQLYNVSTYNGLRSPMHDVQRWRIVSSTGASGAVRTADDIKLLNLAGEKSWLNTCGVKTGGCGTGQLYGVNTCKLGSHDASHVTSKWKIGQTDATITVDQCKVVCLGDTQCESFDYNKVTSQCDIGYFAAGKDGVAELSSYPGKWDYYELEEGTPYYIQTRNKALSSRNFKSVSGGTVDECKDACTNLEMPTDATSCSGWDCTIEGQFCPKGLPGASSYAYTCGYPETSELSNDHLTAGNLHWIARGDTRPSCKSFDYYKESQGCTLSLQAAGKDGVPALSTYTDNPYDYYEKHKQQSYYDTRLVSWEGGSNCDNFCDGFGGETPLGSTCVKAVNATTDEPTYCNMPSSGGLTCYCNNPDPSVVNKQTCTKQYEVPTRGGCNFVVAGEMPDGFCQAGIAPANHPAGLIEGASYPFFQDPRCASGICDMGGFGSGGCGMGTTLVGNHGGMYADDVTCCSGKCAHGRCTSTEAQDDAFLSFMLPELRYDPTSSMKSVSFYIKIRGESIATFSESVFKRRIVHGIKNDTSIEISEIDVNVVSKVDKPDGDGYDRDPGLLVGVKIMGDHPNSVKLAAEAVYAICPTYDALDAWQPTCNDGQQKQMYSRVVDTGLYTYDNCDNMLLARTRPCNF